MNPHEKTGDIWKMHKENKHSLIVIPTNGTVNKNEQAVMGRGLAADAVRKYLTIDFELGKLLSKMGNHAFYFWKYRLITFPVKYEWHQMADLSLIQRSTKELQEIIDVGKFTNVLVPRVGCGNGGLTWDKVKPILVGILDHQCVLVTYNKEV